MRILLMGRRPVRFIFRLVVFFLILPLLFYFAAATRTGHVRFREPGGDAIKVLQEGTGEEKYNSGWGRLMYYIFEFYQNRL